MNEKDLAFLSMFQKAQHGHDGAVENLLESYRNYMRLLARTWIDASLQGKADASDLAQETMVKAHRAFDQFRGSSEPELAAWLRQILARTLIDFVRRFRQNTGRDVQREKSIDAFLKDASHAWGDFISASGTSPSMAAQRRELTVVLADALSDLSEDHREVLVLRSLEELEWEEVANKMSRSEGAVRMLWARALQQLRPRIEARL